MADSGPVDLRSDTVSRPTAGMRRAVAGAEVGDDLFGDDPTVIRLQEQAAALTGKQSALYLPTGTTGPRRRRSEGRHHRDARRPGPVPGPADHALTAGSRIPRLRRAKPQRANLLR